MRRRLLEFPIYLLAGLFVVASCTPPPKDFLPANTHPAPMVSSAASSPRHSGSGGMESAGTGGRALEPPRGALPGGLPEHSEVLASLQVPPGTRTAFGRQGVVTSVEANATRVGVEVLRSGGNAVDAAVAVAYALAVTHPSAGNLGGGGFMLIKQPGQPAIAVDFREQAPLSITPSTFQRMLDRRGRGLGASGIPGSVAGYNLAVSRWGTRSLAELVAPAITLAAEGHALGERQGLVLGWAWSELRKDPQAAAIFGRGGKALRAGSLVKQPALAQTLRQIAARGDAGFYAGPFADALVALTSGTAWPVTGSELRNYAARERTPLVTHYRNLLVETAPPPSAGGVAVVTLLAILEREKAYALPAGSAESLHVFTEAAKRAHAERRFGVSDPGSTLDYDGPALLSRWTNPDTWLGPFPIRRDQVTPAARLHRLYASAMRELDDTTHFSVVDQNGWVVSCTTTLSGSFGARYVVPGTGVIMNNSLGAFSTAGANTLAPGRRMTSSMSPTIVSDASGPALVLGSPGGDTIANTVVAVLRGLVDYHLPLDRAVDEPRIHHGFVPDAIRTEHLRPISPTVRHQLEELGHTFTRPTRTIGDANDLARTTRGWEGYADPREGGLALAVPVAASNPGDPAPVLSPTAGGAGPDPGVGP